MSAGIIATVQAFYKKAADLEQRGHHLRAAEIYTRAAEAARALDPGLDNLVTLDMQRRQSSMLRNHLATVAKSNAVDVDPLNAARRADCIALRSEAMTALARRRVAGSLLEDKCTAAEESWYAVQLKLLQYPDAEAAWRISLYGYEVFVQSAVSAISLLADHLKFTGECSASQLESFAQHVVHAADLMQLPRSHSTEAMSAEFTFVHKFFDVMQRDAAAGLAACGLDARLVQLLTAAWRRLQRSGVVEKRKLLDERLHLDRKAPMDKLLAATDSAVADPGLRSCALAGCGAKEAHPQHYKRCSACKAVVYCSKEHQLEDWPAHKAACKAARKAAAASSEGGGAGPGAAS